jgi:hypothetical protein
MSKSKTPRSPPIIRLLIAIESGDIKLVEQLVAKGTNLEPPPDLFVEHPVHCAVRLGHIHIVEILIRHGADLRFDDDALFSEAVCWDRQDILKLLATTVFSPDLWRGNTLLDIQKEADLIYRNILEITMLDESEQSARFARLTLFDAAMTCWEHVRPDPPKINISDVPAKGKAL